MHGIFITGTDTDVGKTFVGSEIARALTQRNIIVIPRKPIESGCLKQNNELIPADAIALKLAANYKGDLSEVCRYRFEPAISPVRAARLAKTTVSTEQLVDDCLNDNENAFTLVEGAGGFYSPLAEDGLNADFAVALQLPVLLIASNKLGVLNQVLLNVEAIRLRGLKLVGIVLNSSDSDSDNNSDNNEHMDNAADLGEHINCPVFSSPFTTGDNAQLPNTLIDVLAAAS